MITELPFGSTSLKKDILEILKEDGFGSMSPVQAKTIPLLLKGNNVLSLAPNGKDFSLCLTYSERFRRLWNSPGCHHLSDCRTFGSDQVCF